MNRPFLSKEEKKNTVASVPDKEREQMKAKLEKQRVLDSIGRGLREAKLMEEGKLPEPDINDLFKD